MRSTIDLRGLFPLGFFDFWRRRPGAAEIGARHI
jgi:hypothetical protein